MNNLEIGGRVAVFQAGLVDEKQLQIDEKAIHEEIRAQYDEYYQLRSSEASEAELQTIIDTIYTLDLRLHNVRALRGGVVSPKKFIQTKL